jgi:hypothetical protein
MAAVISGILKTGHFAMTDARSAWEMATALPDAKPAVTEPHKIFCPDWSMPLPMILKVEAFERAWEAMRRKVQGASGGRKLAPGIEGWGRPGGKGFGVEADLSAEERW